jgi:tetratricopeptide (TPR) repeat protein
LAARWLEERGERDALLLAEHFDRAGDTRDAARCYADAARQAFDKNDFEAALSRADRALAVDEAGDDVRRLALAVKGRACSCLGRWGEAQKHLQAALLLTTDPAVRMELLRELFAAGTFRQDASLLRACGNEVLELARPLARPDLVSEAMAAIALADHADGKCDEAIARYRVAAEGDHQGLIFGFAAIMFYHVGSYDESIALNERHLGIAHEVRDWSTAVVLGATLGISLAGRGRFEEGIARLAEASDTAKRCGLVTLHARTASISAGWHFDIFDHEGAAAAAREACEIGKNLEFSTPRVSAMIDLAIVASRNGDVAESERCLASVAEAVRTGAGFHGWIWRCREAFVRAELATVARRWDEAVSLARIAVDQAVAVRRTKYAVASRITLSRALAALELREEAHAQLALAEAEARGCAAPSMQLRVALASLSVERTQEALAAATSWAAEIERALPAKERAIFRAASELRILG